MEASQELKEFIVNNKDLILSIEQDPDKADTLMAKIEEAAGRYNIDVYYEFLNLFKELYGADEFLSYLHNVPVGYYRNETMSTLTISKHEKVMSGAISKCNIDKLTIYSGDTLIYRFGIKNCIIDTLTFDGDVNLYKESIYRCNIHQWKILGNLTFKRPSLRIRDYMESYKDCEFIIKNSAKLLLEDINYSIDLVKYLKENIKATNIKIV